MRTGQPRIILVTLLQSVGQPMRAASRGAARPARVYNFFVAFRASPYVSCEAVWLLLLPVRPRTAVRSMAADLPGFAADFA